MYARASARKALADQIVQRVGPKALPHAAVADDKLTLEIENAVMAIREEYPIRFNDLVRFDLWLKGMMSGQCGAF